MRKFLLGVLLLPALALAEPVKVDKTVVCDDAKEMISYIQNEYKENPMWFGSMGQSQFAITINEETQTWSIVHIILEKNMACLIDSGTGFKFKLPNML